LAGYALNAICRVGAEWDMRQALNALSVSLKILKQ
jgi:hypothetical protein